MRWKQIIMSGYSLAVVATALVALFRYLAASMLGDSALYVPFIISVLISARYGGVRAGILATLLGAAAAVLLFVPPLYSFELGPQKIGGLVLFLAASLMICSLMGQLASARQRLESKRLRLRLSDDFHHAIANLATDFAFTASVASDGTVHLDAVTQGFSKVFGYSLHETNRRGGWRSLVYADDMPRAQETLALLLQGESVEGEIRTVARSGQVLWLRYRKRPIRDKGGRVTRIEGALQNITREKQIEELHRASEIQLETESQKMRRLHDLSMRLWKESELEPLLRQVLQASIELLGADKGDIRLYDDSSKSLRIAVQVGFDDAGLSTLANLHSDIPVEAGAQERSERAGRLELHGFIATQSTPLFGSDGKLFGVLSTHFNRAHRPTEHELRLLDLYARQAEWVIERKRAEEKLRAADRRKDEFIAQLAHELRNPLAPLRNSLHVLEIAEEDLSTTRQARAIMERQLRQMVRLVDDLLDLSRIDRDKLELRMEPIELATVISQAVEAARPLVDEARHTLSVSLGGEPIPLHGDAVRLSQAFSNLLNNACKFTRPGGRIEIHTERAGSEVSVSVKDNGVGIAPELVSRIFDKFVQADRSLERSRSGLGIGLALVKRLVEMHGGRVDAHSEGDGRGSVFTIHLPIAAAASAPQLPVAADVVKPVATRSLRLLVVDDNRDTAESLAGILRIKGNDVRTAYDGMEAVEATSEFRPNVVLLDIGLPRLNGYEAARRIRQLPSGRDAVIVAVTGWGQEQDRLRSDAAGIDHHIVKPIDPSRLEEVIGTLVAERRAATPGLQRA